MECFAYRGSKERTPSRAHTRAPTAIFNFLLSQPSQNSLQDNHIQMITALLGTEFVKQTENIAKRCSPMLKSQETLPSMNLIRNMVFLRKKPPFCEGCESKKSKIPGKACMTRTREKTHYSFAFHQDMSRLVQNLALSGNHFTTNQKNNTLKTLWQRHKT